MKISAAFRRAAVSRCAAAPDRFLRFFQLHPQARRRLVGRLDLFKLLPGVFAKRQHVFFFRPVFRGQPPDHVQPRLHLLKLLRIKFQLFGQRAHLFGAGLQIVLEVFHPLTELCRLVHIPAGVLHLGHRPLHAGQHPVGVLVPLAAARAPHTAPGAIFSTLRKKVRRSCSWALSPGTSSAASISST